MVRGRSMSEAHCMILDSLESGECSTPYEISARTGLDRRTVEDIVDVMRSTQTALAGGRIDLSGLSCPTRIALLARDGDFAALPPEVRRSAVRDEYPAPAKDDEVLAGLFLQDALDRSSAVPPGEDDAALCDLAEIGYVRRAGRGRFCLTDLGARIAHGALILYPELGSPRGGAEPAAGRANKAAAPGRPPPAGARHGATGRPCP